MTKQRDEGRPPSRAQPAQVMYRVAQVAVRWGVSLPTIYRWCEDGTLQGRRIGRIILIPREEILRHERAA